MRVKQRILTRGRRLAASVLMLGTLTHASIGPAAEPAGENAAPSGVIAPAVVRESFTGDFPAIRERGVLRALVSFNRTDFFLHGARPRGFIVDSLEEYREHLNEGLGAKDLQTAIQYVIVPFNQLIPALIEGRGDVAAAMITVTPERKKQVDFITGNARIDEVVVAHKDVQGIESVEDLSGRTVFVLNGSSYAEHLRALNVRLEGDGKKPVVIEEADPRLATEDILELVNAGIVDLTVADDFRARIWAQVLPEIRIREQVKINTGGQLGWAVRKSNPKLGEDLETFATTVRRGTLLGNILAKRYYGTTKWIDNPLTDSERKKLAVVIDLFRTYGDRYGFDYLALAAQAYQESKLDNTLKSAAGAVGIMQVRPSTAADPNVGIPDVTELENNVHAGAKYLAFLRERYFNDPALAEEDRLAFTWAAYNAGPAKVKAMRAKAAEMGAEPNRWFGDVEHAALSIVGQETVRYVSNVYKYFIAYKLTIELVAAKQAARDESSKP